MLKFFRQIRQRLLPENRFSKYLLYAVGEIVLVVVGILIALQINNWSEFKKERLIERTILLELRKTLKINQQIMVQDSLNRMIWNKSSDIIISVVENKKEYSDTLNIHFQYSRIPGTYIPLSTSGYENLKNEGFKIISSDSLKSRIVDLFEVSHKTLYESMEYFESFQASRQVKIDELFMYDDGKFDILSPTSIPIIPHDYNSLINDTSFLSMVRSVKVQRNLIAANIFSYLRSSRKVLQMIEKELDRSTYQSN